MAVTVENKPTTNSSSNGTKQNPKAKQKPKPKRKPADPKKSTVNGNGNGNGNNNGNNNGSNSNAGGNNKKNNNKSTKDNKNNANGSSNKQQQGKQQPNTTTNITTNKGGSKPLVTNPEEKKRKREQKKNGKRFAQQQALKKKGDGEDQYFISCRKEATQQKNNNKNTKDSIAKEVELLFSKQGAQGINFNKYDDIKVEVKRGDNATDAIDAKGCCFNEYDELSTYLHPTILNNIKLMNYIKPTPIQKYAIPLALIQKDDLMCCAQTGSGKTCAFLLPIIASLERSKTAKQTTTTKAVSNNGNNNNANYGVAPSCVVLAPTRELAIQIELEARKLCHGLSSIRCVVVYGGASQRQQLRSLAFGADIVVATPGRLTDFVDRSLVLLDQVQFLVLDEADRMLDMGFEPQIRKLVLQSGMSSNKQLTGHSVCRQTLLFSATFPSKIQILAKAFLKDNYAWIGVGRIGSTTNNITQVMVECPNKVGDKRSKLKLVVKALKTGPTGRTLIFVQKKRTATWLKKQLNNGGPAAIKPTKDSNTSQDRNNVKTLEEVDEEDERFTPIPAVDIHGDRSQSQREAALASFRSGACRVLVATDVAARGLDISGVEHVINMDLPISKDDFDSYVHRIGRTGRAGHTGLATSIYVPGIAPKIGNQKIASLLIRQLKESGQTTIEPWLEKEAVMDAGGGGGDRKPKQDSDVRQGGGGGRGRGGRSSGRGGGGGRGRQGGRGGQQNGRGRGGGGRT
jgi:ATP-dependent RNA helicase DDX3X